MDRGAWQATLHNATQSQTRQKQLSMHSWAQCKGFGYQSLSYFLRKWPPTTVFLPENSHGQRNLEGYSPKGHKESDRPED